MPIWRPNRADFPAEIDAHTLDDGFHRERSAVFDRITVPLLSAGNWGGSSLHLRGNVEGFVRAASSQKWLEIHGREHWTEFYTDYGISLQKRFFDHFLKGIDNGWDRQPPVMLRIRTVDGDFIDRTENEWPIARTQWTTWYLDPAAGTLSLDPPSTPTQASLRRPGRPRHHDDHPTDDRRHRNHRSGRGHPLRLLHHHRRRHLRRAAGIRPRRRRSRPPGRRRPAHPDRAGLATRVAPRTRSGAQRNRGGRTTPTPTPSRSHPARSTASTSRSGRRRSSCPPATASA